MKEFGTGNLLLFSDGQDCGYYGACWVDSGGQMRIIEIEDVARNAIDESGI